MNTAHLIPIEKLCTYYKVENTFFIELNAYGLIEIISVETTQCIHQDHIQHLEKMIRLHQDLHLNLEGIDTVLNLLEQVEALQLELKFLKSRLGLYENKHD